MQEDKLGLDLVFPWEASLQFHDGSPIVLKNLSHD